LLPPLPPTRDIPETHVHAVQAVIFDVDDTLFDRRRAQDMVLDVILAEMPGLFATLDRRQAADAFAESDRISVEEHDAGTLEGSIRTRRGTLFLELLGLPPRHAQEIADLYVTRYPALDAPVAWARETVLKLAARVPLAVVSNGFGDVQHRKLEAIGLAEEFRAVVLPEDVGVRKPDPGIFLHTADLLGVEPAACFCVGDLFGLDVVGPKRAGMLACWYNPGRLRPDHREPVPDLEIRDLREIWEYLSPEMELATKN